MISRDFDLGGWAFSIAAYDDGAVFLAIPTRMTQEPDGRRRVEPEVPAQLAVISEGLKALGLGHLQLADAAEDLCVFTFPDADACERLVQWLHARLEPG